MVGFLLRFVIVLAAIYTMETLFPALVAEDRLDFGLAAAFIAVLNAGFPTVLRIAGWPANVVAYGVVVLTLNGILFSLAGPIFEGWAVGSLAAGAAVVVVTSVLTTFLGLWKPRM